MNQGFFFAGMLDMESLLVHCCLDLHDIRYSQTKMSKNQF